jgi:hypothetical protein
MGREKIEISNDFLVADGSITTYANQRWSGDRCFGIVDREKTQFPSLLGSLDKLASGRTTSKYQSCLYDALLLYGRNSVAAEPAEKLVFVIVALESMLLKNATEPIKKNIGERVAWLFARDKSGGYRRATSRAKSAL